MSVLLQISKNFQIFSESQSINNQMTISQENTFNLFFII